MARLVARYAILLTAIAGPVPLLVPAVAPAAQSGPVLLAQAGGDATAGQAVYTKSACGSCHTFKAAGSAGKVGPDLDKLAEYAKKASMALPEFTKKAIVSPPAPYVPPGFPEGTMPSNFGTTLTAKQIDDLVAFLVGGKGAATVPSATPATPPAAVGPGDAKRGEALFTGSTRLAKGGPPCLSCHSIAGIGALGGGTVGPDLTRAEAKYGGPKGIQSVLATLPFPTMQPIFSRRPLTATEQADLAAFFSQAARSQRSSSGVVWLIVIGVAGLALLVGLALVIWPRRALDVRRRMVARSTGRNRA